MKGKLSTDNSILLLWGQTKLSVPPGVKVNMSTSPSKYIVLFCISNQAFIVHQFDSAVVIKGFSQACIRCRNKTT